MGEMGETEGRMQGEKLQDLEKYGYKSDCTGKITADV
jgi:hypothetical protein